MPDLTQAQALQDCFIAHLSGEKISSIRTHLIEQCDAESAKTLYQKITFSDSAHERANDPVLQALTLFVDKDELFTLLDNKPNSNLYLLLVELSKSGHHHIRTYVELIHSVSPPPRWALFSLIGAFMSGGVAFLWTKFPELFTNAANWLQKTFPQLMEWIQKTLSVLKNFTLMGMIFTGLQLIGDWYQTFNRPFIANEKWIKLLFKTISAGLTLAAYMVCTLSAGLMTPLAASLFFFSTGVSVIESIFLWFTPNHLKHNEKNFGFEFQEYTSLPEDQEIQPQVIYYKRLKDGIEYCVKNNLKKQAERGTLALSSTHPEMSEISEPELLNILANKKTIEKSWAMRARYLINENHYLRTKESAKQKFSFALLSTVAIGVWYSYPPSLLMTASCMCFTWLVSYAQYTTLSKTNQTYAQELQKNLKTIEANVPLTLSSYANKAFYQRFQTELKQAHIEQVLAIAINKLFSARKTKKQNKLEEQEKVIEKEKNDFAEYKKGFVEAVSIFKKQTSIERINNSTQTEQTEQTEQTNILVLNNN